MSKIIYRLPSKAVQYGYIEVEGTPEEISSMDLDALGREYIQSVAKFWIGEEAGKKVDIEPPAQPEPQGDLTYRKNLENLSQEEAERLIKDELGATELPWEGEVQADPKPWEKKTSAPVKAPTTKKNLF